MSAELVECVYRSKSPMGPFDPPPEGINPVIYNHDHPDIQNTGHMDLIEGDDGKWIAVFLGVRPVFEARSVGGAMGMPTHLGRESFMAPMEWVDGWPVVNDRKPIELIGQAEGLTLIPEAASFVDNFDQKRTSHELTCLSLLITRTVNQLVPYSSTPTGLSQSHRKARVSRFTRRSLQHRCGAFSLDPLAKADSLRYGVVDGGLF